MNLEIIRELSSSYKGGTKQLAADIGMSESNLHRCINRNWIQAGDLERIANKLGVHVAIFFSDQSQALQDIDILRMSASLKSAEAKSQELNKVIQDIIKQIG